MTANSIKSTISLLGTGWLGRPLARALKKRGYVLKTSTTRETKLRSLRKDGFEAYKLILDTNTNSSLNKYQNNGNDKKRENWNLFLETDILIISIPPKRKHQIECLYPRLFEKLLSFKPSKELKVLFVGSTSVYPSKLYDCKTYNIEGSSNNIFINDIFIDKKENNQDETFVGSRLYSYEVHASKLYPDKASGVAIKQVELLLQDYFPKLTVLRLGGLVGEDRVPGRFLLRKKKLKNPTSPVNLIHQKDAIAIMIKIIENDKWGKIYNGVAPIHPLRKEYYTQASLVIGVSPPQFEKEYSFHYKIVSSQKIQRELNYEFEHPDPREVIFK